MADPKGFMKYTAQPHPYRSVEERVKDYKEVTTLRDEAVSMEQGTRCMDCGIPFCHWACPLSNLVPEWNDLLRRGEWEKAIERLHSTNNFPEFTGRLCPAPCEGSCTLGINNDPVTIEANELAIIEHAYKHGFVKPKPPAIRTGKKVAVVGSGPSGLAVAAQLNKVGHDVTVYEKADKIGGLMRYGIPHFKMEKWVIDRRLDILKTEGIHFIPNTEVGKDISADELLNKYDAICLSGGSRDPRDLPIEGRDLKGVHFALDFLSQSNRRSEGEKIEEEEILATGKNVIVIGGGDTGSDCVGTSNRQGAKSVTQLEILPKPDEKRKDSNPWPQYPFVLKTTSSHKEGCERMWNILTKRFVGENGHVKKLECVKVEWLPNPDGGRPIMKEVQGSEFTLDADLVVLAMGFLHPVHEGLLDALGVEYDARGNVLTKGNYDTSVEKVFSAGDMRRGQSLIVWAISEGRNAASEIDRYLMGETELPRKEGYKT